MSTGEARQFAYQVGPIRSVAMLITCTESRTKALLMQLCQEQAAGADLGHTYQHDIELATTHHGVMLRYGA